LPRCGPVSNYHLFIFVENFASGGLDDYVGTFDTIEEAVQAYQDRCNSHSPRLEYEYEIVVERDGKLVGVRGRQGHMEPGAFWEEKSGE